MSDLYRTMKLAGFNLIMLAVALSQGNLLAQGNEQQNIPIAKELVGKWCYVNLNANTSDALSNSCITLNADGSFEATLDRSTLPGNSSFAGLQDSDYGLWWVKGNRIFYNATTNGQGSFVFQKAKHPREDNAPLLILNGITFASASPHDPW